MKNQYTLLLTITHSPLVWRLPSIGAVQTLCGLINHAGSGVKSSPAAAGSARLSGPISPSLSREYLGIRNGLGSFGLRRFRLQQLRSHSAIFLAALLLMILPACSTINLGDTVFAVPVKERYKVSSEFGRRKGGRHNGIDLAARRGTPILASAPGRVIFAGSAGSFGNLVKLRHPGRVETWYAHLDRITCKRGDFVGRGGKIGTMGATGRATGPHLHFEIRHRGRPYNPARFVRFRSRR